MQGLSKKERLERRLLETARTNDKRKWMRVKKTFFVLSGSIYVFAFMMGKISGNITAYLKWLVVAPVMAGIVMFVSLLVLIYIITGAIEDERALAKIIGELEATSKGDENIV